MRRSVLLAVLLAFALTAPAGAGSTGKETGPSTRSRNRQLS